MKKNDLFQAHRPKIKPALSMWQRIDAFLRYFFPMGCTVFIIVFLSAPIDIPGRNELLPAFVGASIYFWSVYRPKSMPAFGVFMLGFLIDLLNFAPLGVVIFVLLIIYGIVATQRFRLVKYSFLLVWLIFAFVVTGAFVLQWALTSAFNLRIMPFYSFLFQIIFAIGFYPLLSVFYTWAHRHIANPE